MLIVILITSLSCLLTYTWLRPGALQVFSSAGVLEISRKHVGPNGLTAVAGINLGFRACTPSSVGVVQYPLYPAVVFFSQEIQFTQIMMSFGNVHYIALAALDVSLLGPYRPYQPYRPYLMLFANSTGSGCSAKWPIQQTSEGRSHLPGLLATRNRSMPKYLDVFRHTCPCIGARLEVPRSFQEPPVLRCITHRGWGGC